LDLYSEQEVPWATDLKLFTDDQHASFVRFKNGVVKITKDNIQLLDPSHKSVKGNVWESSIIDRDITIGKSNGLFTKFVEKAVLVRDRNITNRKDWTKEYPDVAAIIETIADKKSKSAAKDLEERMAELEEMRINAHRDKAEAELVKMHPDFIEIRQDDAFHTWAEDQPKWVQDALYENVDDAKSVARVIDLYKVDKGITSKKKAKPEEKAAASSVKTKGSVQAEPDETSKYIRESEVAAMSIKEYEKRAEEIMEAQRSGNFIYDITRK